MRKIVLFRLCTLVSLSLAQSAYAGPKRVIYLKLAHFGSDNSKLYSDLEFYRESFCQNMEKFEKDFDAEIKAYFDYKEYKREKRQMDEAYRLTRRMRRAYNKYIDDSQPPKENTFTFALYKTERNEILEEHEEHLAMMREQEKLDDAAYEAFLREQERIVSNITAVHEACIVEEKKRRLFARYLEGEQNDTINPYINKKNMYPKTTRKQWNLKK